MKPCIWLLSAYRSDSHAYWADGLVNSHSEFDWQVFELPGRHFAWRIRSNPLSWIEVMSRRLTHRVPQLILASSMVDLATLKGLHPALAGVRSLLYFHENQLAYPIVPGQVRSIEPAMVQIYAALVADRVLFNSEFNQSSFLRELRALAQRLPDGVPRDLAIRLENKSSVLPVAVDPIGGHRADLADRALPGSGAETHSPLILWNHRWEHDKRPERFADALIELDQQGVDFQLALLGSRSRSSHPALELLRERLAHRIAVDGFQSRPGYTDWLQRADIVVSTAGQEFQGISMLEAVSAGAWPLVPDRLCYPEQYPSACRYDPESDVDLTARLCSAIETSERTLPDISAWLAPEVRPRWSRLLSDFT